MVYVLTYVGDRDRQNQKAGDAHGQLHRPQQRLLEDCSASHETIHVIIAVPTTSIS